MPHAARFLLVGCLAATCGCTVFRSDGPRQSLREVIGPPHDDQTSKAVGQEDPPSSGDVSEEEVYKRLFDQRKALDEIDPNEYGDLKRILERTPPSLQPLVVQEIVMNVRKTKLEPDERENAQSNVGPVNIVRPSRKHADESVNLADASPQRREQSPRLEQQATEKRHVVQHAAYVTADEHDPTDRSNRHETSDRWQVELTETIKSLEAALKDNGLAEDERNLAETYLRLLHLIAGDAEAAVKPVQKLDPIRQEYWKNQIHALSVLLDQRNNPLHDRRAALALDSLRRAVDQLSSTSALEVRNVAFCYAVDSYGQYKEFAKYQFKPNDQVLLYAEIDNFTAEPTNRGMYETSLAGSYQVYDPQGNKVAERNFPVESEVCRNRRRDFFIPYRIYIPQVNAGRYNLQLTMRDLKGKKTGQSALIEFTVTD